MAPYRYLLKNSAAKDLQRTCGGERGADKRCTSCLSLIETSDLRAGGSESARARLGASEWALAVGTGWRDRKHPAKEAILRANCP